MGLFDRLRGKSMEDPVPGTAKVLQAQDRTETDALISRTVLKLVVSAEGLEPTNVTWKGMVKAHKRPRRGGVLPVTVDRANPEHVEIDWDEAPNVVKQLVGGTYSDLTAEQKQTVEETQAKVLANSDEFMKLTEQFKNGEIDQDELMKRSNELMGEAPDQS